MSAEPRRFGEAELLRLAAGAVHKIDLLGPRGTTLCSMDEIDALAAVAAMSGLLPSHGRADAGANETPMFSTRRNKP